MLEILDISSIKAKEKLNKITQRQFNLEEEHEESVKKIINDVKAYGDNAILSYTRKFDAHSFGIENLVVSEYEVESAYKDISIDILDIIKKAIENIEKYHLEQKSRSWFTTDKDSVILGQLINPVERAGIYVPGGQSGKTPLVSSVMMGVIPAMIAGVKEIYLATPPDSEANINPYIIVTANECGVKKIFKMGSAWAIAAFAIGTNTIPKVDVIAGPGNIYVTLAKKILYGTVGIDMIAGPSEILIIADEGANPSYIAADMLSQAEHDPLSLSILITTSNEVATRVIKEIESQINELPRKDIAKESLRVNGAVFLVRDIPEAVEISNQIAPEHLEILVKSPWDLLPNIRNAGAIFMGEFSPEPLGDYFAGPNHVLPTMGTARFSSPLSVDTFIKKSSIICYSKESLLKNAGLIKRLAMIEGLDAHSLSIEKRMGKL